VYNKEKTLEKVDILYAMRKNGNLGGEIMPEDANTHLEEDSNDNRHLNNY